MDTAQWIVAFAMLGGVVYLVRFSPWAVPDDRRRYCPQCGYTGPPRDERPGSAAVTLVLAFFFIVPALIYEAWRSSSRREACPKCGRSPLLAAPPLAITRWPATPAAPETVRARRECPHCAELIMERARVCKHCNRDVPPASES